MSTTPSRQDIAREFLRVSAQEIAAANFGLRHSIHLARKYDLPWADIAQQLGLSEKTCQTYHKQYTETRREAAA